MVFPITLLLLSCHSQNGQSVWIKKDKGVGEGGGDGLRGGGSVENQLKIAMDDLLLDACATHLQFDCPIREFGIIAG
jgi:hypothetical protein